MKKKLHISNVMVNNDLLFKIKNKSHIIKKEDIPYLFDRFFKARSGKTGETQGYGLGLSICQKIVENHNGKISLDFDDLAKIISFKIFLLYYPLKKQEGRFIDL